MLSCGITSYSNSLSFVVSLPSWNRLEQIPLRLFWNINRNLLHSSTGFSDKKVSSLEPEVDGISRKELLSVLFKSVNFLTSSSLSSSSLKFSTFSSSEHFFFFSYVYETVEKFLPRMFFSCFLSFPSFFIPPVLSFVSFQKSYIIRKSFGFFYSLYLLSFFEDHPLVEILFYCL